MADEPQEGAIEEIMAPFVHEPQALEDRAELEEPVRRFDVADRALDEVLLLKARRIARVEEDLRERIAGAVAEREAAGRSVTNLATPNRELIAGDKTTGEFAHGTVGFYDDTKGTFTLKPDDKLAQALIAALSPELVTSISSKVVYEIDKDKVRAKARSDQDFRRKLEAAGVLTLVYNDKTWVKRHPSAVEIVGNIEPNKYEVIRERH